MNCEKCLNSRPVISENGIHSVCCLSSKKACDCFLNNGKYFVEHPAIPSAQMGRFSVADREVKYELFDM